MSQNLGKFIDALSTMEPEDVKKITNTVRKYEVKGTSSGIQVREPMDTISPE